MNTNDVIPELIPMVLEEFRCPILHEIPEEPVMAGDGHIYDRTAIRRWLQQKKTSPMTNLPMSGLLTPALHVKNIISTLAAQGLLDDHLVPSWARRKAPALAGEDGPEWTITLDDASTLRDVVSAAANFLSRITFRIAREKDDEYYLMVDAPDNSYTCYIIARIHIHSTLVLYKMGEYAFSVVASHLLIAMENASCLTLEGSEVHHKLSLRGYDKLYPNSDEISTLDTFADNAPCHKIRDITYDLNLVFDTCKFLELLRKGRDAHATTLRLIVNVCTPRALVRLYTDGDIEHSQHFARDITMVDGAVEPAITINTGDRVLLDSVYASGDGATDVLEDAPPILDNTYPIDKIEAFLRTLQTSLLHTMAGQNMPLLFLESLGGESHMRFLVAPM